MSLFTTATDSAPSARISSATSHGPVTPNTPLLPGESPEAFAQFHQNLRAQWRPVDFSEDELVAELAGNLWQTTRVQAVQSQLGVNCAARLDALDRKCQRLTGILVRLQKRPLPREAPGGATPSSTASSRPRFVRRKH